MSKPRISFLSQAVMLALLLWAQSAVAVHDLEHSFHESVEVCQVFANADHGKALVAAVSSLELARSTSQNHGFDEASLTTRVVLDSSARAPPVYFFTYV